MPAGFKTHRNVLLCSSALLSGIRGGSEGLAGELEEKAGLLCFELNSLDCLLAANSTGSLCN